MNNLIRCFANFLVLVVIFSNGLREQRTWSIRSQCDMAEYINWPFAYTKYHGQYVELKGRVNSNLQDFRHECQFQGGRSKCHICEEINCESTRANHTCSLQIQGVTTSEISTNIPTVNDFAWPIGGNHRTDYGGAGVTHYCVLIRGGHCHNPTNQNFTNCHTRCFGYGFPAVVRPKVKSAPVSTIVDTYPGQHRWQEDGLVDLWEYPGNCSTLNAEGGNCTYSGFRHKTPSFNPQGYTFTFSGSGKAGFKDGNRTIAEFYSPEGLSVDKYGYIYVADTLNNAIRTIDRDGTVTTIAGLGPSHAGYKDGKCSSATFSSPKAVDIRYTNNSNHVEVLLLVVADTNNHRIRQIEYIRKTGYCRVSCLSGLCGNSTLSETLSHFISTPHAGYADGPGAVARFSAPQGVAFLDDGYMVVSDTGNFLIRLVSSNGSTWTLAGSTASGMDDANGNPSAGCPPPCLRGVPGYRDGNLTYAQFKNPVDVARGPNNTVILTDENRIRLIEFPNIITQFFGIRSMGRVSTIAGNALQGTSSLQGYEDGMGEDASFFEPSGIILTSDNIMYVADAAECRIRRIMPVSLLAQPITCATDASYLVRPSGCTSYEQPVDKTGRKISRVEGNVQFNYGWPYDESLDRDRGKYIKNCVGSPPPDTFQKHFVYREGDNLVIDDNSTAVNEDSEQGMTVLVLCPSSCLSSPTSSSHSIVYGTGWYSDDSSVCMAALHDGKIIAAYGGYVQITLERMAYIAGTSAIYGSTRHGVTSYDMSYNVTRVFKTDRYNISTKITQSIGGHPAAVLEDGCGYRDAQPPQAAYFNKPKGIAAYKDLPISDTNLLYVSDTGNNVIRCISAVCTVACENNGKCVAADKCECASGWTGVDCTLPICNTNCGLNKVCVGPNLCACKPGYSGTNCDIPQCVQSCLNGGTCVAPDTCGCPPGWFDTNCSTPVCAQTCANGANCTAPNACTCPSEWKGHDCRTPVCEQTCHNGGYCMAPNTCTCPPQWSNYDCSVPVCTQGYFKPNPSHYPDHLYATELLNWAVYKPCDLEIYCNQTQEFECLQTDITYGVIEVASGGVHRKVTGRKRRPKRCMQIELPTNYRIPFELLRSDNTTTGYWRYTPITNYTSNDNNPWRGYYHPTGGHTGPWTYQPDRQIAIVQWLNMSQGIYLCANGGNCTAPDVCECAAGWMGFDCRTPVCDQGYFFKNQKKYVSGLETASEVKDFRKFMGYNSYRLQWHYSNPNYTMQFERYVNQSIIKRYTTQHGGIRYYGPSNWATSVHQYTHQGGYRCSVRAFTQWEHVGYVFEHPNFYSRYMDTGTQHDGKVYTNWSNMHWPPVHEKSRILVNTFFNVTYIYTNEGYRLYGIWNRTGNSWEYGTCIMEFSRNCSMPSKALDLESGLYGVYVQDTDLSYRSRVTYNDRRVFGRGRWNQAGGTCVDEVVRGCYNNGSCVAPNTCRCAPGWSGYDCSVPVCEFNCYHHGNCTLPNVCTCERGWEGVDCRIPICAQECQNGGYCIAPDTCKCPQWPNEFTDGRVAKRPYYRKPNGDAQDTGWTGYDCSVPICVQGTFHFNVLATSSAYEVYKGRGGDDLLECTDNTGTVLPRCPQYDYKVTSNDGRSFQAGCGHDPYDDGCCIKFADDTYHCYKCHPNFVVITENTFFCTAPPIVISGPYTERTNPKFAKFVDSNYDFRMCGRNHTPFDFWTGESLYYKALDSRYSNYNYRSNLTSNRFLCNVRNWTQGDYIDAANLSTTEGMGTWYGLSIGRHVRVNNPNIQGTPGYEDWTSNGRLPGEGIYSCYNYGSCIAPDTCTCTDGYDGYDCMTPLCRHLQPSGAVTSCLNGGICGSRDTCYCTQTKSVLADVYPTANRGLTGFTGSDCSIPMCMQGYFDPFCTDLPQAPGGEGCYRCANGGNCTAPDVCQCADGWTGFDCRTPVCEIVATPLIRVQLGTVSEDKVISFESDPCGVEAIYGRHGWHGHKFTRGNCTRPNQCTCLCFSKYDPEVCFKKGKNCDGAWQDPMADNRDVLTSGVRKYGYVFGSTDCIDGYEGSVDTLDRFTSCHLQVYVPTQVQSGSIIMIYVFSIFGFLLCVIWYFLRRRLKQRYLLAKIERRRSRRSSEESLLNENAGAFGHS